MEVLDLPYLSDCGCPVDSRVAGFRRRDGLAPTARCWVGHLLARGVTVVNTSGDQPPEAVPMVAFQGSSVIATAVEHLGSLGRRQAVVRGCRHRPSIAVKWRVERYSEACARAGMADGSVRPGDARGNQRPDDASQRVPTAGARRVLAAAASARGGMVRRRSFGPSPIANARANCGLRFRAIWRFSACSTTGSRESTARRSHRFRYPGSCSAAVRSSGSTSRSATAVPAKESSRCPRRRCR